MVFCFHNLATRNFPSQIPMCQNPNLSAHTQGQTSQLEVIQHWTRSQKSVIGMKFWNIENLNDITTPATMLWIATCQDSTVSPRDKEEGFYCGNYGRWKLLCLFFSSNLSGLKCASWDYRFGVHIEIDFDPVFAQLLIYCCAIINSLLWLSCHHGWIGWWSWCCLHSWGEVWH